MEQKKTNKIWLSGLVGFVLATLLVTVGFWKTVLILIIAIISAGVGYFVEDYNIGIADLTKLFTHKN